MDEKRDNGEMISFKSMLIAQNAVPTKLVECCKAIALETKLPIKKKNKHQKKIYRLIQYTQEFLFLILFNLDLIIQI